MNTSEPSIHAVAISRFRWTVLFIVFVGEIAQGLLYFSAVPLVLAIERDLHLAASQVAFWLNLRLMFVFLCAIPIGLLIDRLGPKRLGRIGFVLLGIGATARGFAASYPDLLLVTAIYALGSMTLSICLPKVLAAWFPSTSIGMASGIYLSGYGLGAALALAIVHPAFGANWEQCLKVTGIVGIIAAVLWWTLAEDPATPVARDDPSTRKLALSQAFKVAARSRITWLLTGIFFLYVASITSWFTFGFAFLSRYRNVSQNSAGVLLMLTMIGYTVSALTTPALSDRLGYRRPFLFFFALLGCVLFATLIYWKTATGIALSAVLLGTFFGTTNPLIFTIAAEANELGPSLMGASVGIISSVSSVAGFVIPTLTGKYLGSLNTASEHKYHVVLALAAIYVGAVVLLVLPMPETGRRATKSIAATAH